MEKEQRDHFLALVTPDLVKEGIDGGKYEKEDCAYGLLWGEAGRAWIWMELWDGVEGRCVLYTDV